MSQAAPNPVDAKAGRLLLVMQRHVGRANAIPMRALYREVYGQDCPDKINTTRKLRELIDRLQREEQVRICSVSDRDGGGYFLAGAVSELDAYCAKLRSRALKLLKKEADLRDMSLAELMGSLQLAIGGGGHEA